MIKFSLINILQINYTIPTYFHIEVSEVIETVS